MHSIHIERKKPDYVLLKITLFPFQNNALFRSATHSTQNEAKMSHSINDAEVQTNH